MSEELTANAEGEPATGPAADDLRNLEKRTASSAAWTMGGYVGSQLLRLLSNLVLTRLLFEEAFGLMALMQVVLQALFLLSDIGIGPSLIHNPRVDRRFIDTAFSVSVIRGVVLFAIGWIFSAPLAAFYDQPQLAEFLPFVAFTAFLNGLESTKNHTLNRELRVERIQIARLASQLMGTITTIIWALIHPSIWALMGGVLVANTSRLVLGHLYLPGRINRFAWDFAAVRALVKYGSWIFIGTLLSFLAEQSDRLVFGKLIPLDTLGVYSIAVIIATLPFAGLAQLSWKILFPYFSRLGADRVDFAASFERMRGPLFVLGGWALAGLISGGPTAIRLLYDERYYDAGWMVQILSIGIWFQLLSVTNDAAAWGRGKPQLASLASLSKLIGLAIFIPVGYSLGGSIDPDYAFAGAVAGLVCSDVVRYFTSALASTTLGLRPWRTDARLTATVAVTSAIGAWLDHTLRAAGWHVALVALAIFVTVSLLWLPIGGPVIRRWLRARHGHSDVGQS